MAGELPQVEFAALPAPPFDPKKVSIRKKLPRWGGVRNFLAKSVIVRRGKQRFLAHDPQDNAEFRSEQHFLKLTNGLERAAYSHSKQMARLVAGHGRAFVKQRMMTAEEILQRAQLEHFARGYAVRTDLHDFFEEELAVSMGLRMEEL